MKSKSTATLLAFFLGMFGAHKFYLGDNGMGILYIIITLFGWILFFIPTLILYIAVIIEFILLLVMTESDFDVKYNNSVSSNPSINNKKNSIETINHLHEMKEKGILSEEEFIQKKDELMKHV